MKEGNATSTRTVSGAAGARSLVKLFLGAVRAGVRCCAEGARAGAIDPTAEGDRGACAPVLPPDDKNGFAGRSAGQVSTMILPQVHLRKPCYDFSFL
jgi:hypothetical protein